MKKLNLFLTISFYSQRSFLEKLSSHVSFIKSNDIEFCMALCKELSDDTSAGITFKCVKDCYNMLDIVELEKSSNGDDPDDEENLFNPSGYEELAQALRSVIWSNVDMNHGKNSPSKSSATKLIVFFPI